MKLNINGSEALQEGMRRAGIGRIFETVNEPELTADEAMSKGSFFASKNIKSACIIDENDVQKIETAYQRQEMHNTSLLVIVVGKEINYVILHKIYAYNLPFWYGYSPASLYEEIYDASIYSEIVRKPAVIYVPKDVLRQREPVNLNGTVNFYNYMTASENEKEEKKKAIEERYNMISESQAEYAVIAEYRTAGFIKEVTRRSDVVEVIGMDMFYPVCPDNIRKALRNKKVLIYGRGSGYLEEILTLAHCLPWDVMRAEDGLREALELFIPKELRMDFLYGEPSDEMLQIRKPTIPPVTDFMCEGCKYRERLEEMLSASPFLTVYEDIFCARFGSKVRSGMANAESPYMCDLVVTNRDDGTYTNLPTELIRCSCIKEEK